MKKRMYQRGVAIADMNDLADQIRQGRYMYWLDKPMHPSFVNNMTMNTVRGAISRGILSYALPYTKEKGGTAQELLEKEPKTHTPKQEEKT